MKLTPIKAIRLKCLDCCCDSAKEVKMCDTITCPLYPYRFGRRPKDDDVIMAKEFYKKRGS